jgi:F-type H+-transporting ATPase subunit b
VLARITTSDGQVLAFTLASEEDVHEGEEEHGTEAGAEEGGHGGVEAPNPILPATNEVVWGALSFLVLFVLLAWKAFPAVKKTMDERTNRIRESLDDADRTRSEAQQILEDYQRQLADAKNEAARVIEEAKQAAEQMRRELMAKAEAEAAQLRQRSMEEITAAQERAMADMRAQVATIAVEAAEVVVRKNLDRDTNLALVESFIEQVGSTRA